jgi:anti-sigma B factor antagonist
MLTFNREATVSDVFRTIDVERIGDVWIAHLKSGSLDETWIDRLGQNLLNLVHKEGCRKLVLHFGELDCLYSTLLGKLVNLRKVVDETGGRLKIYGVSPLVKEVFRVCKLDEYFEFARDRQAALKDW